MYYYRRTDATYSFTIYVNLQLTPNLIDEFSRNPTSLQLSLLKQQTYQTLSHVTADVHLRAAGMSDESRQCC